MAPRTQKPRASTKRDRKGGQLLRGKRPRISDDEWIRLHFRELVDNHAGKYAVVAEGELFIGEDAGSLFAKARRLHPGVIPTGLPIPRPQDFACVL